MRIFERENRIVSLSKSRLDVLWVPFRRSHWCAPVTKSAKSDNRPLKRSQSDLAEFSASEFKARLQDALHGRPMAWLSERTGISKSMLSDYLRGKIPGSDKALRIAQALDVNLEWLLSGERCPPEITPERAEDIAGQLEQTMIPEVDLAYSMGGGSFGDGYIEERRVPFRRDWIDRLRRGHAGHFFLARGAGDSMMPTILDGDDVLINRAECIIRSQDRIWALNHGGLGMIKRVRRQPSGMFELNSDNQAISTILSTEDDLKVIGRVVWIGRAI